MAYICAIMALQFRELGKVFLLHLLEYGSAERRIYESHATALEAGAAETSAIDAVGAPHDLV
jgi:hypothetical protein